MAARHPSLRLELSRLVQTADIAEATRRLQSAIEALRAAAVVVRQCRTELEEVKARAMTAPPLSYR